MNLLERQVRDVGPLDAPLVLIGEAPGAQEVARGLPFVGRAGYLLDTALLEPAGLSRKHVRIMNVAHRRPPAANKIESMPRAELDMWADDLHARLAELKGPRVLVPMGNTALRALLRKPLYGKAGTTANISDWRGFLSEYTSSAGWTSKVIPTYHPAFFFHAPGEQKAARVDWQRIAGDLAFPDLRLTPMTHNIDPTEKDITAFTREAARASCMSIDIETIPEARVITCVGFSYDPAHSLVIEIPRLMSQRASDRIWGWIEALCMLDVPKVGQNFNYDVWWLDRLQGIVPRNIRWDLMYMSHALDSSFPAHDLGTIASCDLSLRIRYWKTTRKDPEEKASYDSDREADLTYNGIDNCVQRHLATVMKRRLIERGKLDFYLARYRRILAPTHRLSTGGMTVDEGLRRRKHTMLRASVIRAQDELAKIAGYPLHAKKGLSHVKVKRFFYETLGLPPQRKRKTKKVTTDAITLRKLAIRFPDVASKGVALVLRAQRDAKLSEFCQAPRVDEDGRLRSSYRIDTMSGRFSSKKNHFTTGSNAQNNDHEIRDIYVADPGDVLVEVDMSQAESRIVGMLTGDRRLIELAHTMPWEFDMHRYNASIVFSIPEKDVTPKQRNIAKPLVHGSNYGEHGATASDSLLKKDIVMTPDECQRAIDRYLGRFPAIKEWQRAVRMTIMRDKKLVTLWGRELNFDFRRFDDELYRKAYAFVPSATVADALNEFGFIPADRMCRRKEVRARVIQQGHDSLLFSCHPDDVVELITRMKALLERPMTFASGDLTIPTEFKIGYSWGAMEGWKQLPAKRVIREQVQAIIEGRRAA